MEYEIIVKTWSYDGQVNLALYSLDKLPVENKDHLFNLLIQYIDKKKLTEILERFGYFTLDRVKEQKGCKITDKDKYYFDHQELTDYVIGRYAEQLVKADSCLVVVKLPEKIRQAAQAIVDKKKAAKEKRAAAKLERQKARAKKLLGLK